MPNVSIRNKLATLRAGKLTKSQKRLLDYFEGIDLRQVIYMSITDLAVATGVAEATVLRFCRSLGFNGYQEFRLSLAQGIIEIGHEEPEGTGYVGEIAETYIAAMKNCRRTLSATQIEEAIELISKAKSICCFGVGHSYLAALELHNRLMMMGLLTHCERDTHMQNVLISSRGEEDLIVIFSISGSSKDTVEAAELARANGMKIIVITCYEKSPLTRYADLVISASPMDSPMEPGAMSGKVMQLFLVDVLSTGIHRSEKSRYDAAVAKSSRATAGKLI